MANGEEWKRHRRIVNPVFNKGWNTKGFGEKVLKMMSTWEISGHNMIDISKWTPRLALDIFSSEIFGIDFKTLEGDSELYQKYNKVISVMDENLLLMIPSLSTMNFLPRVQRSQKYIDEFNEIIYSLIREKRANPPVDDTSADLLDRLIAASDKEEDGLTDRELRVNLSRFQ
ncbi:cytochrome P450 [Rozella allomycis CSF55]|uniref:Cytochrome P450 n=1 Tax=Rozella allomycis (strain CSF55) TaxID=988480 RepID=A0A4P9Y9Q2_ROZAC|nr:cytochrome P450 [Rozella allomycis CSF55]